MQAGSHNLLMKRWRSRTGLLLAAMLVALLGLTARFLQLTVLEHGEHTERATLNTIAAESVRAPRGRIYDRKGRLMVSNTPTIDLYIVPAELENPEQEVWQLAQVIGERPAEFVKKYREGIEEAPLEDMILGHSLSAAQITRVSDLVEEIEGAYLGARGERRYSYGTSASHLVGYVGTISQDKLRTLRHLGYSGRDFLGKTGLEKSYDEQLRGRRGLRHRWVDAAGHTLKTEIIEPPTPGNDLYLNIDMALQLKTERALSDGLARRAQENGGERSAAAAVVLNAQNGEIVAMASLPNFDPRPFARGIKSKEYAALLQDKNTPLVSRATHASFSPGSTYKMMTGMAALQLGLTGPGSYFVCGGAYKGANCFVRSGHGGISFTDAIAHSCDVVFYRLGDRMGIKNLARYSRKGGLGKPTGVDLPNEDPGLFPDPKWKERVWEQPWYGGDTINSSIGQGFILVTPLQMARLTAAVANGGTLHRPRLVDRTTRWGGQHATQNSVEVMGHLPVEPGHLATIRRGMRGAVTHGTSTVVNLAQVKVAGKTGTVESFPNPYNPHGRNHTWFVCFAPYEKPKYAIAVFFQKSGGYGGGVAAPVAREILEHLYPGKGESP